MIRCGCICARSARSCCSRVPRRWRSPSASRRAPRWPSDHRPQRAGPARRTRVRGAAPAPAVGQRRRGGEAGADPGQPPARGVDRQAVRRPGNAAARPHPGGEPGLMRAVEKYWTKGSVLDLRHLVDPPGHHPGHRRSGPDDPDPRPHGESINRVHRVQRQMLQELERAQRGRAGRSGRLARRAGAGDPAHQSDPLSLDSPVGEEDDSISRFIEDIPPRRPRRSPPGTSWGMPSSKCSTT